MAETKHDICKKKMIGKLQKAPARAATRVQRKAYCEQTHVKADRQIQDLSGGFSRLDLSHAHTYVRTHIRLTTLGGAADKER